MTQKKLSLCLILAMLGANISSPSAHAGEITALVGKGYSGYRNITLAYQTAPFTQWQWSDTTLDLSLEYSLGLSQADTGRDHRSLWHIGLTPVLRWWFEADTAVEAAIGANLFSGTHIGTKNISTAYQFGDSIGILHRITGSQWAIGLRFTHYSNAGIKNPNPGQGYFQVRVSRRIP